MPKYEFYEVVRIEPKEHNLEHLRGQEGAILGMAEDDHGNWSYAVHLYGPREVWNLAEPNLVPTGRMDSRENFYDSASIHVEVDPQTNEGKIARYDD